MLLEVFMNNSSVLFLKKNDSNPAGETFLNLAPFVLDENAYDAKSDKLAKLYFFERYNRPNSKYLFRHIYKQEDALLEIDKENSNYYNLVKSQYNAFSETVLKLKFDEL